MSRRSTTALVAGIFLAISSVLFTAGTAHAEPTVSSFSLGAGIFAENSTVLPDGSLAVSASDGLHHVFPSDSGWREDAMFLEAQSLGGVILKDGMLIAAVGNNGGTGLDGVIWEIDPSEPAHKRVLASGISAPNGLAELSDGRIAYSTNLGPHAGIHAFDPEAPEYQEMVNLDPILTPNGLSMGPDGFLYVCSTAGSEVMRVDLGTGRVTPTGKFVPFCDDLTVTQEGIFAASVAGVWDASNFNPFAPTLLILKATSIKPADDGDWVVTDMDGGVHLVHF